MDEEQRKAQTKCRTWALALPHFQLERDLMVVPILDSDGASATIGFFREYSNSKNNTTSSSALIFYEKVIRWPLSEKHLVSDYILATRAQATRFANLIDTLALLSKMGAEGGGNLFLERVQEVLPRLVGPKHAAVFDVGATLESALRSAQAVPLGGKLFNINRSEFQDWSEEDFNNYSMILQGAADSLRGFLSQSHNTLVIGIGDTLHYAFSRDMLPLGVANPGNSSHQNPPGSVYE